MAVHEQVVPSWACRVSWKELCPTPKVSRATAQASRLSPWVAALLFVLTLWAKVKKRQKKVDKKYSYKKITQLISPHLVRETGYEAGIGIGRLLGKASNTAFSRDNKTGCNLPVCTTTAYHVKS